jgi:hypothetical protein
MSSNRGCLSFRGLLVAFDLGKFLLQRRWIILQFRRNQGVDTFRLDQKLNECSPKRVTSSSAHRTLRLQRQNESLKAQLETYKRAESFSAKVFNMNTILSVTMLAIAFGRKLRHG